MLTDKQNKKVAIMQPYLFPYVGYFQLIKSVDTFILFDNVNYIKKGWINRNRIAYEGVERLFTIPLKKASQNKLIREIELFEWDKSKGQFLSLIETAYKGSKHFSHVLPVVEDALNYSGNSIAELNMLSLKVVSQFLDISTQFVLASEFAIDDSENGVDRIFSILKQVGASTYINAPGGRSLYSTEEFNQLGFTLRFLQPPPVSVYQQNKTNLFIPYLSIIDLMMNVERETVVRMVNDYNLEV